MNTTLILTALTCLQLPAVERQAAVAEKQTLQPLSLAAPIFSRRKVEAVLRRRLEQERISIDVTNKPLSELVRDLEKKSGIPMRFDQLGLEESGILLDEPITARCVDLPVGRILSHCLEDLKATWLIRDEAVLVLTQYAARTTLKSRSIEVSRLLAWIRQNTTRVERDRFGRTNPATTPANLLTDIVTSFGSGFWRMRSGGDRRSGSVSVNAGVITIRQSHDSLKVAARLVEVLQQVSAQPHQPAVWYVEENGFGTPACQRVASKLQEKTTFSCADAPLEDVIDYLRRESGLLINVDVVSLEEAGVLLDEPITLRKTTASLDSILSTVLDALQLVHLPRDNGLFVTTKNLAFEYLVSAVFDVRDLVGPATFSGQSLINTIMHQTSGQWEDTDPGGNLDQIGGLLVVRQNFQTLIEVELLLRELRHAAALRAQAEEKPNRSSTPAEDTRFYRVGSPERAASVHEAIISFVFPDRWESNGGTGFMREVGTTLVVRQTPEVHEAIEAFLAKLPGDVRASPK